MREWTERLRSAALGNERTLWIREPAQPKSVRALTLFLDGEIYRGQIAAPRWIEELVSAGEIADTWVVYVSAHDDEARWRECPCYPPFAKFITGELLPFLLQRFPLLRSAPERTLVGASYTGLAAAFVALARPGVVTKVISQSGSFWWNEGWLIERCGAEPKRGDTQFYLEVGSRETQARLQHRLDVRQSISQLDAVRRFRDVLAARGYDVTYVETAGAHAPEHWQKTLPDALRWALPVAASAGSRAGE